MTHRQAVALSGRLYRAWAADDGGGRVISVTHDPVTDEWERTGESFGEERVLEWEAAMEAVERLGTGEDESELEAAFGSIVDRQLLREGIHRVDARTREVLLQEFRRAFLDAADKQRRNAEGDFTPDPKAERFPEWAPPGSKPPTALTGLLAAWRLEAEKVGRTESTLKSYRLTIHRFVGFLGHDDATRVTADDVIRYKDHRLGAGVKPKTIKDSDLAALKAIFAWAVANRRLPANPAKGVTLRVGRAPRSRSRGFLPEEATAILSHARGARRGGETEQTFAAKQWVPLLCAYTGARVGEMCQLRKSDIRREGKEWIITITPEAGTVKTKEVREVPLHPHLVELGFPRFVMTAGDGYLFFTPSRSGWRGPCANISKKVAAFVREVVSDKRVAPNHGWRHLFKTRGIEAGIQERVLDAICGHAPKTVGGAYGEVTIKAKVKAVRVFPAFRVGEVDEENG